MAWPRWRRLGSQRRLTMVLFAVATPTFMVTSIIAALAGIHALYGVVLGAGLALFTGGCGGLAARR